MPILELILNPFAGAAGFNLVSFMFYLTLALLACVWILERSFTSKR